MPGARWSLRRHRSDSLPLMAWLLRARPPVAELTFGRNVVETGAGIFEGTWTGEPGAMGPLRSTTPFGSGVIIDGDALFIVTPGHMLEGVYYHRRADGELIASNSLPCLLAAAELELDPDIAYPPLFNESVDGVMHTTIPTTTEPFQTCFHDNLRLELDGRLTVVPKPREPPFASFANYRDRLSDALRSALGNAAAGLDPVVTISSGYDGAAIAVLAAELGCRRAVTVREGKRVRGHADLGDSGEPVGRQLGMEVEVFERLAYQHRDDMPEAEFLATGFSGEEVVMAGMDGSLAGSLLLTGFFGDGMWWMHRPPRPVLWRSDQSGSSLGEWRLRVGFTHVPLACFGAHDYRSTQRISHSPEMRPWVLGRRYDKPIPRRILEEAGVPRGTFGEVKRAASATIHVDGPAALSPASRASLEAFARNEGRRVAFSRRAFPIWARAGLKVCRSVGAEGLARRFEQRKLGLGMHEPAFGSLLVRWAAGVVAPRYRELSSRR